MSAGSAPTGLLSELLMTLESNAPTSRNVYNIISELLMTLESNAPISHNVYNIILYISIDIVYDDSALISCNVYIYR